MKRVYFKHFVATLVAMLVSLPSWSADGDTFTANTAEDVQMTFKVISESEKTCQVGDGSSCAIPSEIFGTITIPSSANGYSVTSIGESAISNYNSLESITIPSTVTSIGNGAFSDCWGLTSITIPEGVTSIGDGAFCGTALTSIIIPSSVTSIGIGAFGGYSNLTSITVANGNSTYDSRDDCNAIIETSTNTLIRGCKNTIIPSTVTSIGEGAFSGCTGLTSITIPSSVTTIGSDAFSFCSSLTSITIPEGVTSIGVNAFHECSSLTSITIPSTVTSIGGAFSSCPNMVSMAVDSNNTYYDSRDNCNAIIETGTNTLISGCKNTVIPSSVQKVLGFSGCTSLTSITIPEGVSTIGESAFQFCSNLTSVTLPSTLREIDVNAFNDTGLTTIDIPEGVTSIGIGAFGGCSGLTSITIPSTVTTLGGVAFYGCSSLSTVISERKIPIELSKFDLEFNPYFGGISSDLVLYVPEGTKDAYIDAGWTTDIFKGGIIEMTKTMSLTDGETYSQSEDKEMDELSYSRTYKYSAWLPWYVPFDVELTSDVLSRFSFAKFCGTYTEDDENGDMVFCITVSKLKEGDVVKANTPYVIKAKTASNDAQVITLTNTTLKAAEEKGFDMYSAEKKVSIQGIYSDKTATANDCDWYFINSTGYVHASAGQTLGAYRFYLTITDRTDNPYASASNPNGIKMKVLNEDGTTVLEEIQVSRAANVQQPEVYDLSGRRVANGNQERGIYIINGKKVLVK